MKTYLRSIFSFCSLSLVIVILFSTRVESQILTDEQLFLTGRQSYDESNYSKAVPFLFAYIQRQPEAMTEDPEFAKSIWDAYSYAQSRLDKRDIAQQKPQEDEGSNRWTGGLTVPPPQIKMPQKKEVKSYKLLLRGGGNLYFSYEPYSNFSTQPQIWITFERSSVAAGNNMQNQWKLNPGQASWLDRPISMNEPNRIISILGDKTFSISWHNDLVSGISSELQFLTALRDSDQFVTFEVYNDRKGNFIVTKIE